MRLLWVPFSGLNMIVGTFRAMYAESADDQLRMEKVG